MAQTPLYRSNLVQHIVAGPKSFPKPTFNQPRPKFSWPRPNTTGPCSSGSFSPPWNLRELAELLHPYLSSVPPLHNSDHHLISLLSLSTLFSRFTRCRMPTFNVGN
ncbi:hypothetical protein Droror1_Dr00021570 [Drosera rotundifolia]